MAEQRTKITNPFGSASPPADRLSQDGQWEITGAQQFSELTGRYSESEARSLLIYAQEQSVDRFAFDQFLSGRGPQTPLLSGSQLLAALELS